MEVRFCYKNLDLCYAYYLGKGSAEGIILLRYQNQSWQTKTQERKVADNEGELVEIEVKENTNNL